MRAVLPALAIVLASASGLAQAPAKLVDSQSAVAVERPARRLVVAVPMGIAPGAAAARFLHVAGERGARYASGLSWVWTTRRGYQRLECRAPLGFRYSAYPPTGQRWIIQVGREHCRPTRRVGLRSEIRGHIHPPVRRLSGRDRSRMSRRARSPMSRREMRRMSRLLEPPEAAPRRRYRRRQRRRRASRQLSRREIRAMSRELE